MTATDGLVRTEPPSDAQLDFIARLAEERGFEPPAAHSKREASLLIGEMLSHEYRPPEWDDYEDVPF